jgi:hypothetical protein
MAHLTVPGQSAYSTAGDTDATDAGLHRVSNAPGYSTPIFTGKAEQHAQVLSLVEGKVHTTKPRFLRFDIDLINPN